MSETLHKPVHGAVNITYGPSNGYVYFFHPGGTYSRFDRLTCQLEYYSDIVKEWNGWPPHWTSPQASVSWDNQYVYFFHGSEYVAYDMINDIADGAVRSVEKEWLSWPKPWLDRIDAGLYWGYHFGQKKAKAYFFRDDEYVRYELGHGGEEEGVEDGYPLKIKDSWPGWPVRWGRVTAAIDWGNGKVYFFSGEEYLRYDKFYEHVDSGYPRPISDFLKEHEEKLARENKSLVLEDQVPAPQRAAFTSTVRSLAAEFEIRPNWLMASMWTESGFKPDAGVNGVFVGLHQLSLGLIYNLWGKAALAARFPALFDQKAFKDLSDEAKRVLAKEFAALGFDQIQVVGRWLRASLKNLNAKCRSYDQLRLIGFGGQGLGNVDRTRLAAVVAKGNPRYDLSKDGTLDLAELRAAVFDLLHERFGKDPVAESGLRHDLG
ncbi:MAG TPA: hemopexin repeat-containing protein [Thermoanaerobaculia bacterium]|nr:hemopexin repeat-containing protein [Thermoanaerobaculia bacterium]